MSSLSGAYYQSSMGSRDFEPDQAGVTFITPLYAEIIENIAASKSGLSISKLAAMSKITKHHSRVRLALEELTSLGILSDRGGVYSSTIHSAPNPPKKQSKKRKRAQRVHKK
ncbi:hypothetical protein [Hydrogenovibrio marinus]|uniref:Uncharacterized protein n=1 Tax=Hydrogenovibrio marinus TaxID=28885 RepID=A0A066ZX90_HYDMR|nr:hypothetical protein [Hydrogenovibrio marinus]KDN94675.1 hypothetical protein EI16_12310 [Hydrogenovibrio marinus]